MVAIRKLWTVLVGAYGCGLIAALVLRWLLGLDGTWVRVAVLAAGVLGGLLSVSEARAITPMEPQERRNTSLGWGALIGGGAAVTCLLLGMPWGVLAGAAVTGATVLALRRV